jgi:chemotaxis protein MotB
MPIPKKNKPLEEENNGAPEWMVTFSDCMTLLLTFFVLLISFATFDTETLPQLGESFAKALPAIGMSSKNKKDSMLLREQSRKQTPQEDGSETPTDATVHKSNFMKEKKPLDFRNLKVFTIASNDFFWGNGTALTQQARQVLDALAEFLTLQSGRIVISENGPDANRTLGLERCLSVMNYLSKQHQIQRKRFNLSTSTTLRTPPQQRQLEITLLDRSVYE